MPTSVHIRNSSYREMLIEHLLVGEIMRRPWLKGITQFEVLQKLTRGDSRGFKKERPNHRVIPRSWFERLLDYESLVTRLCGEFKDAAAAVQCKFTTNCSY